MKKIIMMLLLVSVHLQFNAQTKFSAKDNINMTVSGTSTMHDWDMKTSTGSCEAVFTMDGQGKITGLSRMSYRTTAKSLKSGKGGMDKNAYKALKSDDHPEITAVLKSATVVGSGDTYTINSKIDLTIAGKTVETDLVTQAKLDGNIVIITGEKKIDMNTFDIKPPSFMLGSVKTGKDVVLKFNLNLMQ